MREQLFCPVDPADLRRELHPADSFHGADGSKAADPGTDLPIPAKRYNFLVRAYTGGCRLLPLPNHLYPLDTLTVRYFYCPILLLSDTFIIVTKNR